MFSVCSHEYAKGQWKICTSYLLYNQIWLNLLIEDLYFFYILLWMMVTYSIPTSAQYVTLHTKIRWKRVSICRFGSGKWFLSCIFAQFPEAGTTRSKGVHLLEKSVINMMWKLVPVFDWAIIMIGPGGLLLVVPHLFAVQVSLFVCGVAKKVIN
jgi:hypothetical protein